MNKNLSLEVSEQLDFSLTAVTGQDLFVPVLNGTPRRYVNLDNAASTPAFRYVEERVVEFLSWYSSVHRGAGFKSLLSTHALETSRKQLMEFVGADMEKDCAIFVKNTTEAINKLSNRLGLTKDDVVLTTMMEHHSNDLPWRSKATTVYVEILENGALDLDDLKEKIDMHKDRLKLVTVTGASNVTGIVPPVYDIAELAHAVGACILVDCAQLAPHRRIMMGPSASSRHLDFIALSGHKMYAPFGTGALIGSKRIFSEGNPDYVGGGTIEVVTLDQVYWAPPPESDEAGSPNVVGAVALAASLRVLNSVGMENVARHERDLTAYALEKIGCLEGVRIYGPSDVNMLDDRLGVIAFSVDDVHHAKIASILSFEAGIGVRHGCFCAHPYVLRLLGIPRDEVDVHVSRVLSGDRSQLPGLVRASFGIYNTKEDVDVLVEMLDRILAGDYEDVYQMNPASGEYLPRTYKKDSLNQYFYL
jgi:selenocysteine lyase/cysteine desulfurase